MNPVTNLIRNPLNSLTEQDRKWLEILHPEQIRRITANFAPKGCAHSGQCANKNKAYVNIDNIEPLELPGQPAHNRDAYTRDVTPMPLPGEWE